VTKPFFFEEHRSLGVFFGSFLRRRTASGWAFPAGKALTGSPPSPSLATYPAFPRVFFAVGGWHKCRSRFRTFPLFFSHSVLSRFWIVFSSPLFVILCWRFSPAYLRPSKFRLATPMRCFFLSTSSLLHNLVHPSRWAGVPCLELYPQLFPRSSIPFSTSTSPLDSFSSFFPSV